MKLDDRVLAGELGLDVNEPGAIQGAYSGVSARSALRRLLSNVFETPLTYVIRDEILLITDKQYAADNYLSIKVYPVADLVIPVNPNSGVNPFQAAVGLAVQVASKWPRRWASKRAALAWAADGRRHVSGCRCSGGCVI